MTKARAVLQGLVFAISGLSADNRAGDYLGSISDLAADQEKLNKNLGVTIREKNDGK